MLFAIAGVASWAQGGASQAPDTQRSAGSWYLGSHSYGDEFGYEYEFTNNCDAPLTVSFNTTGVPFLNIRPSDWTAAPGKVTKVRAQFTAPPWPDRPQCTDLQGTLIVSSTGYQTEDGVCHPSQTTYTVTAHAHWWNRGSPPEKLKSAGADACTVWWNTGQRPANARSLSEDACLETIRTLAANFRERVLDALLRADPARWTWLPSASRIKSMSVPELLEMRKRAAEILGWP